MASNFNNFNDQKPIVMNSGNQQSIGQMNLNAQNVPRPMSSNSVSPRTQSTPNWQGNNMLPAQNSGGNQGYMASQMRSQAINSNQQLHNNTPTRVLSPQIMQSSNMMHRSPTPINPLWQGSPTRAMPPHISKGMTIAPGSPSRTLPPSWPSSSPRQTSTFVIQPSSASANNSSFIVGQQVYKS